jgi:uncharacterized membrane protein YbhN (UPF0104 family)
VGDGAGASLRRAARTVLRFLPLGLLAVVLWREKPWAVRLSPDAPWAVTASILLNLAMFLPLKAVRWRVALTDPPPFRQVLAATIEGLLANAALGFGSGDVVRSARLRRVNGARLRRAESVAEDEDPASAPMSRQRGNFGADYAASWAERGAEVLALAVLVFVIGLVTDLGAVALALSGAAAAGYVALLGAGRFLVPRLGGWPRAQRALSSGLQASAPRRVAAMVGLSLLGWTSEIVMLVLFQHAFHIEPSLRTALLTLVGLNAAIVIPAVPGNFGTFEAGVATALVLCGAPRDVAVSYAVAYHLSHVLPVALIATAVFLYRSRRYRTTPARTST